MSSSSCMIVISYFINDKCRYTIFNPDNKYTGSYLYNLITQSSFYNRVEYVYQIEEFIRRSSKIKTKYLSFSRQKDKQKNRQKNVQT